VASVLTNYLGNLMLATQLVDKTNYLALFAATPGVTGSLADEIAGGGYARQPVTFTQPGSKTLANTDLIRFDAMPACVVTWLAVCDAVSAGNVLFLAPAPYAISVDQDDAFVVPAGALALTI
jgi:hypothetical protein